MKTTAFITGVNGQDGSYLAELLLSKGYFVIGLVRRSSTNTFGRIKDIVDDKHFMILEGDVADPASMSGIIIKYRPDEIYHLAAMSHVGTSFNEPSATVQANTVGTLNIIEAVRQHSPHSKVYFAGTSEMFGHNYVEKDVQPIWAKEFNRTSASTVPPGYTERIKCQDENTAFNPNSPYAVSKVSATQMCRLYRNAYNLHINVGILFNHESPRRGENFVTKKITKYIGGLHKYFNADWVGGVVKPYPKLKLGNLEARRDWGYAKEYVEVMWKMLQQPRPDDFVIATGQTHSIKEFLTTAFSAANLPPWDMFVEIDESLLRPNEVPYLLGNSDKAYEKLGWYPKTTFEQLVELMVKEDIDNANRN